MIKNNVDILLPYWGDFKLLKQTVESVASQSNPNWRLLVFDDCYPSLQARDYFETLTDKRISYYRHEKNIGITDNFNYALDAVTAEFCVMIGCDDMMLPNYVESALGAIGDADFYQPGVEVIDQDSQVYSPLGDRVKRMLQPRQSGVYGGEKLIQSLCIGNWLYFPSIMWRSETVKCYGFDRKYSIVEDVVLELSILRDGGELAFDKTVTFQYRRFADSLSSREKGKGGVRFKEEKEVYDNFAREFADIGWRKAQWAAKIRLTSRLHETLSR